MAISTAKTTLSYKTDATYTKLCDITSYPDLGASPSKLDTTTLSAEKFKTYIFGLQEVPDLTFEANYTKAEYAAIRALAGTAYPLKLEFGAAGVDGSFTWNGQISVYPTGHGADDVRKMMVTCSAETEITFA